MYSNKMPPMKPLAPLVDRMRTLARTELPSPRAGRVRLWDDGTFSIAFYHLMGQDERQQLYYVRSTSEIVWVHQQGARWREESLTGGETVTEPEYDDTDVRVIETVTPPYTENSR